MGSNEQKRQETAEKKKRKFRLTFGRVLGIALGVVAVVYMLFSVQLFYNFMKIMITDPDAAKQQEIAVEAQDEMDTDEKE